MSSTSTKWTTDTNTKSGTVQVYANSVSVLKITADNDSNAILDLFADQGDDNADKWRMWASASDNDLHFSNYTSGAWVDKLKIADGGTITIGKLHVQSANASTSIEYFADDLVVEGTGATGITISTSNSQHKYLVFGEYADADVGWIKYDNADNMTFKVNGTEDVLYLKSDGKVGIGDTSPQALLSLMGNATNASQPDGLQTGTDVHTALHISNTGNETGEKYGMQFGCTENYSFGGIFGVGLGLSGNTIGAITFDMRSATNATALTEVMRINYDGKVGIGIMTPPNTLSVSPVQYSTGTASQSGTTVTGSGTTWTAAMIGSQFVYANGTSSGVITARASNTSVTVTTSQTVSSQSYKIHYQGLQVKSDGKVGIGTNTPTVELELAQTNDEPTFKFTRMDDSISSADSLGKIQWTSQDADGTSDEDVAGQIQVLATETHDGDDFGSKMLFYTSDNTDSVMHPRMVIHNDGDVAIGTANANRTGYGTTARVLTVSDHSNAGDYGVVEIAAQATSDSNPVGELTFVNVGSDASLQGAAHIRGLRDGDNTAIGIGFFTEAASASPTIKMTLDSAGYLGIGSADPNAPLHVEHELDDDGVLANFVYMTADNTVDQSDTIIKLQFGDDNTHTASSDTVAPFYLSFHDSDSGNGSVSWNADHTVSYNTTSDYRIKTDIKLLDSTLDNINKLKPCSFYLKKAKVKANGFIAHELQEVFPGAVTGKKDAVDKDGKPMLQNVDASKLVPFLVKAIQELSVKVTALESN